MERVEETVRVELVQVAAIPLHRVPEESVEKAYPRKLDGASREGGDFSTGTASRAA
ncbi:MAG: hypothetical protein ACC645_10875 [Pirellulales bacterium]